MTTECKKAKVSGISPRLSADMLNIYIEGAMSLRKGSEISLLMKVYISKGHTTLRMEHRAKKPGGSNRPARWHLQQSGEISEDLPSS